MSFEESLIHNASPTMASIKVANLYNFGFNSADECHMLIKHFNSIMNEKGVYIKLLKNTNDFYLIYVYRKSHLQAILEQAEVKEFLNAMGYPKKGSVEKYLNIIKTRLRENTEFPHEIGVFLGYPLSDVKAFIKEKGENSLVCGDWKAYNDETNAKCTFYKYKHCKEVYIRTYRSGRKLYDLLVST